MGHVTIGFYLSQCDWLKGSHMTKVVWLPNKTDYPYCEFMAPNTPYCNMELIQKFEQYPIGCLGPMYGLLKEGPSIRMPIYCGTHAPSKKPRVQPRLHGDLRQGLGQSG